MKNEKPHYGDRITVNPKVMVGKPVIRGTRIPVERIIGQLAHNPDLTELFAAYPELTLEDVKASLEYAHAAVARESGRGERLEAPGSSAASV